MTETLILTCSGCGGLLLAKGDTRTRLCPHCGFTVKIEKAKKVGSAPTAQEASILLKKIKMPKQPNEHRKMTSGLKSYEE